MLEGMTVSDYKKLLDDVIAISYDMEDVDVFPEEYAEDVLKCKYIIAIHETLSDVPLRKAEWFFKKHKIKYEPELEIDDLLDA
jgi:hypothetical protein